MASSNWERLYQMSFTSAYPLYLAKAARKGTVEEQRHELGDVLAWLASLANQLGLSLDDAAARYASGCPRCGATPCACP